MIRVSRLADYALIILATLAQSEADDMRSASQIANASGMPEPTVAKVLKILARAGIVMSVRGAAGGYALGRPLGRITAADVIVAIDGPISLTACVESDSDDVCDYAAACPVKDGWGPVNKAIREALENVSVAEMIGREGCSGGQKNNQERRCHGCIN